MSLYGSVRARLPRALLELTGNDGAALSVEFIVDTGFDGELALPPHQARSLADTPSGYRTIFLADGSLTRAPYYEVLIDWDDEERLTEVLALEGNALLGTGLLWENTVTMDLTEGGEVSAERM